MVNRLHNCYADTNFRSAVEMFSFNLLNFDFTFFLLYILSTIIPILTGALLFNDLCDSSISTFKFLTSIISKHLFYGYMSVVIIYVLDLINDTFFTYYYTNQTLANYNIWHKYIFHSILTPIFFLDAIYSMEIERIKYENKNSRSKFKMAYYLVAQVFFGAYLLYGLLLVLYFDNQLSHLFNINTVSKAYKIGEYLPCLINDLMVCVFVPLLIGILDQGLISKRIFSIFNIYTNFDD